MKQILLAGCGKMGTAMLQGWLEGLQGDFNFTCIDPALAATHPLRGEANVTMCEAVADGGDIPAPDMIVLAVKPQMMAEALPPLVKIAGAETVWLSIAAGISVDFLRGIIGGDAHVIRAMPNTPAAIGRGITAMVAGESVPPDMLALAQKMLAVVGKVVMLDDEDDMDAVTATSGSGPAYVFLLREALEAAAIKAGLAPDLAMQLAAETITGAALLMDESSEAPAQLRINVTSPGGTTEAAMKVLMAEEGGGLETLLTEAVLAARDRSRALGKGAK